MPGPWPFSDVRPHGPLPALTWDFKSQYLQILQTGAEVSEYCHLVYDRPRVTRALSLSRSGPARAARLLAHHAQPGVKGSASGQIGRAKAEGAIGIRRAGHHQMMSLTNDTGQETVLEIPTGPNRL